MKKLFVLLLVLFVIGCSSSKEENTSLKILAPSGAPALALAEYVNQKGQDNITIVEGSDFLQAALLKDEYDAIIAPINLGIKLINSKSSNYQLKGVISWGNLYEVENEDLDDGSIAAFGQSSIVGIMASDLLNLDENTIWFNAVSEVSAALLSQKVQKGVLAQPVLAQTLSKASENGINLKITNDLNSLYQQKYDTSGYPQASLFIKEENSGIDELVECLKLVNQNSMLLLEGKEEFYGIKSYKIIYDNFDGMNIKYVEASECQKEISMFLGMLNIDY